MKAMTSTAVSLVLLALTTLPAHAAEMKDIPGMKETPGTKMDAAKTAANQSHEGKGTVNSVDPKAGKVNLTHGPIPSLNWPGMKMDFAVKDKEALAKLKAGEKVIFKLVEQAKDRYVITEIKPAK